MNGAEDNPTLYVATMLNARNVRKALELRGYHVAILERAHMSERQAPEKSASRAKLAAKAARRRSKP